jgi:hypothetical protein
LLSPEYIPRRALTAARRKRFGIVLLAVAVMTEQNRKYIKKEIGKLLSEIWRIKGQAE